MTAFLAVLCMLLVVVWGGIQVVKALDPSGEIRKALHTGILAWISRRIG